MSTTAGIVGRDDVIEQTLRALADPACDGVFLVGEEPGVGATTVLDGVLARLDAQGRRTNRIVASRGNQSRPFAALAHVLPIELPEPGQQLDPLAMFDSSGSG